MTVATEELEALVHREHANPHSVLGAHPENGGVVIRALRPAACEIKAHVDGGSTVPLEQIPVERITGPVLTIGAGDDQVWSSAESVNQIEHRLV